MPLNPEVSRFLDESEHPLRKEIEALRLVMLQADSRLAENIKWNGPNYAIGAEDRITMRINPHKQIQLIFHRGAKVKEQPKDKLISEDHGLLVWKENDRAIASFITLSSISANTNNLTKIIQEWLNKSIV